MIQRPCLWVEPDSRVACGALSTAPYCPAHAPRREKARHNPLYDDARWRRLRKRVKLAHIRRYGYMCPGWEREPHLASTLHADHIVPVTSGGAMFDAANVQVLCGTCNDRKGKRAGVAR